MNSEARLDLRRSTSKLRFITNFATQSVVLLAAALPLFGLREAAAQTLGWTASSEGLWSTPGDWTPSGIPTAASDVYFGNPGSASGSFLQTPGHGQGPFNTSQITSLVDTFGMPAPGGTIQSLRFTNYNDSWQNLFLTNGLNPNTAVTLNINSGMGLIVGNGLTGTDYGSAVNVSISGISLDINYANYVWVNAGGASVENATLDLSGLENFNAIVGQFLVGVPGNNHPQGTVYLAANNTITAVYGTSSTETSGATGNGAIVVGDGSGSGNGTSFLYLGNANTINADTILTSRQRTGSGASILFNPYYASSYPPTATFAGYSGERVSVWSIGDGVAIGSANENGTNDFSLGAVSSSVDTMYVGRAGTVTGGTGGTAKGTLIQGDGVCDVNNLYVGYQPASGNRIAMGSVTVFTGSQPPLPGFPSPGTLLVNDTLHLGVTTGGTGAALTTGILTITNGGEAQINSIVADPNQAGTSIINLGSPTRYPGPFSGPPGGVLILTNQAGTPAAPLTTLNLYPDATIHLSLNAAASPVPTNMVVKTIGGPGTATIVIDNISGMSTPGSGTFPLISYTGTDPFSEFTLGALPSGYIGTLVDNVAAQRIDLQFGAVSAPTASAGPDQSVCWSPAYGTLTVQLAGTVTEATGGTWSGGAGTFSPGPTALSAKYEPTAAEIAAGSVTLTLTTTGQGATYSPATSQMTITINQEPTADAGSPQTICAGQTVTLAGSIGGSATGGTWSTLGSGTFDNPNNYSSATYTPSAADIANGSVILVLLTTGQPVSCTAYDAQVTITIVPAPTVYNMMGGGGYCAGSQGSSVSLSGSQVGVNYQLFINGAPTGSPVAGTGTAFTFGDQTVVGTYTAVATSGTTGCSIDMAGSVGVSINPKPAVFTVTGGGTGCSGGSGVDVGLSGSEVGVNYELLRNSVAAAEMAGTGSAITFPAQTRAGTYTVRATETTGGCGAIMSGSATVTINPAPTVNQPASQTVCNGELTTAISFTGTATSFDWVNDTPAIGLAASGSGNIAAFTAVNAGLVPVVATITVTPHYLNNSVECGGAAQTFSITVNPLPVFAMQPVNDLICRGTTASFAVSVAGQGPLSYQWQYSTDGGVTWNAISGATLSTYSIPSTDASHYVNGYQFRVQVTGAECPSTSLPATLIINPTPTALVSAVTATPICNGGSAEIQATLTGTGPWNVTWSDQTQPIVYTTSPATRDVSPSSTTTYTVTALSDANCTAQATDLTGSATVTVSPLATAVLSLGPSSSTICAGSSVFLELALTGTGPWNVTWSDQAQPVIYTVSPVTRSVSPATTTTYTVTALTDSSGCPAQAANITGSVTITVNPVPSAPTIVTPTSVCAGSTYTATVPFQWGTFTNTFNYNIPPLSQVESATPWAVTAADVNGDGKLDLICVGGSAGPFARPGELAVLTNDGSGGFELATNFPVGTYPQAVIAADVNRDGSMDLICANSGFLTAGSTITIFTNNGTGVFASNATLNVGSRPVSLAAADVNGDGFVDLISANQQDGTLTVLLNDGTGNFSPAASSPVSVGNSPESVIAVDVKKTGVMDLVSANYEDGTVSVLINDGAGNFSRKDYQVTTPGTGPVSVTATDVDGDGFPDLICANPGEDNLVILLNQHDGTFMVSPAPPIGVGHSPTSVTAADVNADGFPDLICANNLDDGLTILTNNGTGEFTLSATVPAGVLPGALRNVIAADLNGDGHPDLITADTTDQALTVFLNTASSPYAGYSWTVGPTGEFVSGGSPVFNPTTPQVSYTVFSAASPGSMLSLSLTVSNASGCTATTTANIPVNLLPTPILQIPIPTVCEGSSGNMVSDDPRGDSGAVAWSWVALSGGTITGPTNQSSVTFTAGPASDGFVVLQLTSQNAAGCSATANFQVPIIALPDISISADPSVCPNSHNVATGSDIAYGYSWSITGGTPIGPTTGQSLMYNAGSSGSVVLTLIAENVYGCTRTNSVTIPILEAPVAGANQFDAVQGGSVEVPVAKLLADASNPEGGTLSITAVSPTSVQNASVLLSPDGQTITYDPPGSYAGPDSFTYTLSDDTCTAQGTVSVTVTPGAAPSLNNVAIALPTGGSSCVTVDFLGIPGFSYVVQWSADGVDWTSFPDGTITADSTGLIQYQDCTSPQPKNRFYRTILSP